MKNTYRVVMVVVRDRVQTYFSTYNILFVYVVARLEFYQEPGSYKMP